MGVLDKLTGKDHKAPVTGTTQTGGAYAAYDPNAPNTTGIAYGAGTAQQPYATHDGTAAHGTHHEKKHGLLSKTHNEPHHGNTGVVHGAPTGGIGGTGAPGTHGTAQGYPAGATAAPGTYNDGTAGYGNESHNTSSSGGLFKKKDDLEDSLEKERKAKADLDAAMARHQAAQQDASGKLQAKEDAARIEFEAAQKRLQEAQEARTRFGH